MQRPARKCGSDMAKANPTLQSAFCSLVVCAGIGCSPSPQGNEKKSGPQHNLSDQSLEAFLPAPDRGLHQEPFALAPFHIALRNTLEPKNGVGITQARLRVSNCASGYTSTLEASETNARAVGGTLLYLHAGDSGCTLSLDGFHRNGERFTAEDTLTDGRPILLRCYFSEADAQKRVCVWGPYGWPDRVEPPTHARPDTSDFTPIPITFWVSELTEQPGVGAPTNLLAKVSLVTETLVVPEGLQRVLFTLRADRPSPFDVPVQLQITGPYARGGTPHPETSTAITLRPGEVSASLEVPVPDDDLLNNNQVVEVSISDAPLYRVDSAAAGARVDIIDNDHTEPERKPVLSLLGAALDSLETGSRIDAWPADDGPGAQQTNRKLRPWLARAAVGSDEIPSVVFERDGTPALLNITPDKGLLGWPSAQGGFTYTFATVNRPDSAPGYEIVYEQGSEKNGFAIFFWNGAAGVEVWKRDQRTKETLTCSIVPLQARAAAATQPPSLVSVSGSQHVAIEVTATPPRLGLYKNGLLVEYRDCPFDLPTLPERGIGLGNTQGTSRNPETDEPLQSTTAPLRAGLLFFQIDDEPLGVSGIWRRWKEWESEHR